MEEAYYNPSHPGSFGGVQRLYKSIKKTKLQKVRAFLESQAAYSKHKQRYGAFPRRKVTSPYKDYLWQADLVFVLKHKKQNKGFAYILTAIDVLSRYGFAIPVKDKSANEMIRAFSEIFRTGRKPKYIQTDSGKEFFNKKFHSFLNDHGIGHYHNYSDLKACVVERFNRTIMTRLSKYFTFKQSTKYLEVLPEIVESYNASVHRSIGISPKDVSIENEMEVWEKSNKDLYTKTFRKPKLKLHDKVRLCKNRGAFVKGFAPSYTSEIFEISEVMNNSVPVTFRVRDVNNETISGIFYEQELGKVN
jgi:hypothetical protein